MQPLYSNFSCGNYPNHCSCPRELMLSYKSTVCILCTISVSLVTGFYQVLCGVYLYAILPADENLCYVLVYCYNYCPRLSFKQFSFVLTAHFTGWIQVSEENIWNEKPRKPVEVAGVVCPDADTVGLLDIRLPLNLCRLVYPPGSGQWQKQRYIYILHCYCNFQMTILQ